MSWVEDMFVGTAELCCDEDDLDASDDRFLISRGIVSSLTLLQCSFSNI